MFPALKKFTACGGDKPGTYKPIKVLCRQLGLCVWGSATRATWSSIASRVTALSHGGHWFSKDGSDLAKMSQLQEA